MDAPSGAGFFAVERLVRRAALLVAAAAAAWGWANYGAWLRFKLERRLYPAIRESSPLAAPIADEARRRRLQAFSLAHRRVAAMAEAAGAQGLEVRHLGPKLERAAALAREGEFDLARRLLNAAELQIPRPREPARAVTEEDMAP